LQICWDVRWLSVSAWWYHSCFSFNSSYAGVRLLAISLMHKFNSDKSMTIKIGPLFNFKCTELTLRNRCILCQVCWITSVRVSKHGKNIFLKFHCFTMLKLTFIDLLINCICTLSRANSELVSVELMCSVVCQFFCMQLRACGLIMGLAAGLSFH